MTTERERADWWGRGWWRAAALGFVSGPKRLRRHTWAQHRRARAVRAGMSEGPRCWYCEQTGHSESEESCWLRSMHAELWMVQGAKWMGRDWIAENTP